MDLTITKSVTLRVETVNETAFFEWKPLYDVLELRNGGSQNLVQLIKNGSLIICFYFVF